MQSASVAHATVLSLLQHEAAGSLVHDAATQVVPRSYLQQRIASSLPHVDRAAQRAIVRIVALSAHSCFRMSLRNWTTHFTYWPWFFHACPWASAPQGHAAASAAPTSGG